MKSVKVIADKNFEVANWITHKINKRRRLQFSCKFLNSLGLYFTFSFYIKSL